MKTKLLKRFRKQAKERYYIKKSGHKDYALFGSRGVLLNSYKTLEHAIRLCDEYRRDYILERCSAYRSLHAKRIY